MVTTKQRGPFGNFLRTARRLKGLKVSQMSKDLNINEDLLYFYESGGHVPQTKRALKIVEYLGYKMSDAICGVVPEGPVPLETSGAARYLSPAASVPDSEMTFGQKIKYERLKRNMLAREVAKIIGVANCQYSAYEADTVYPREQRRKGVEELFGMDLSKYKTKETEQFKRLKAKKMEILIKQDKIKELESAPTLEQVKWTNIIIPTDTEGDTPALSRGI